MKKKKIENFILYLSEQLGQGSFGKVYKGVNQDNKQVVAIKVLNKKQIDSDEYVKQALVSEIKIMKKVHSEFIVDFVDVLQTGNNYYIVQEFCNGGDLRAALKAKKYFPENVALYYLESICTGFHELISNGIIHRDVKPENILIHDNKIKIADFGFAKNVLSKSQLNKTIVGTPLYMSPQVLKQQKYSSKCDIWAIGLLYYEFLYGKIPWTGRSQYQLVSNIIKIPLTFPKEIEVSEISKNFITGCLKIEQQKRFGWDDLYNHPIFKGKFSMYTSKKANEKVRYIVNNLRIHIHTENIDLQRLFENLKLTNQTTVKKQEFHELLITIDQKLDQNDTSQLFEFFDTKKIGSVLIADFKKQLEQSGVRLKSLKPILVKKKTTEEDEEPSKIEKERRINEVIIKLSNKIELHKMDLYTVYSSYDKLRKDSLDYSEFSKLITKIDSSLSEQQLQLCFHRFDLNNDGQVSFQEFYKTICKIAGEPSSSLGKPKK